ncbi:MAG: hypothetical protein IPL52_11420 [Flavobacteriales bacterium]|nr:hypothetical protein [Flavobacteriales bacterium]
MNAYRVLLTRGREGVLICLPRSSRNWMRPMPISSALDVGCLNNEVLAFPRRTC